MCGTNTNVSISELIFVPHFRQPEARTIAVHSDMLMPLYETISVHIEARVFDSHSSQKIDDCRSSVAITRIGHAQVSTSLLEDEYQSRTAVKPV